MLSFIEHAVPQCIRPIRFDDCGRPRGWTSTQGQGFVFEVAPAVPPSTPSQIYGGWFTYKSPIAPFPGQGQHWYGLSEEGRQGFVVTVGIYEQRFTAPPSFNSPNLGQHLPTRIGQGTLTFRSCEIAEFEFSRSPGVSSSSLPQATGRILLQRLLGSPECSNNTAEQAYLDQQLSLPPATTPTALPFALTGVWGRATANGDFDPAYSGQGMMMEVFQGATTAEQPMSVGWYSYNGATGVDNSNCSPPTSPCPPPIGEGPVANGSSALLYPNRYRWLTIQPWTQQKQYFPFVAFNARQWVGGIYITAGGLFNAGAPAPNTEQVGRVRIEFLRDPSNPSVECNQATVTYEFQLPYGTTPNVRNFDFITGNIIGPFLTPPLPNLQSGSFRIKRIFNARNGCQLP